MDQKEIERRYNKLLEDVATKEFYLRKLNQPDINCYYCKKCGAVTKTQDIHPGVTPFMIRCKEGDNKCDGDATSSFYNDMRPNMPVTHEWYRPSLAELIVNHSKNEGMLDHILNGGLELRKVKTNEQKAN